MFKNIINLQKFSAIVAVSLIISIFTNINYKASSNERIKVDSEQNIRQNESIPLKKPDLSSLIQVSEGLDPLNFDASNTKTVNLKEVLDMAVYNNLTLKINDDLFNSNRWKYYSNLGKFLPDILMNYNDRYLYGNPVLPGFGRISVNTPFLITSAGFRQTLYQGGRVMFGTLQAYNQQKAQLYAYKASTNDVLFNTYKLYNELLLNQAILRIRIRAVDISKEQYQNNVDMQNNGVATKLDVLQSRTQLSKDRQQLIAQQVKLRVASVNLTAYLNTNMAINYIPSDTILVKRRLVDKHMPIGKLLQIAIDNRAELKQYEQLRLAAKRAIVIASANLQPNVQFAGNIYGIGPTLSNPTRYTKASYQPYALSGSTTSTQSLAPIQTGISPPAGASPTSFNNVGAAYVPPTKTSTQIGALYTIGFNISWNFMGLGVTDMSNIKAAQYQAKQAGHEAAQELIKVMSEVRTAYLNSLSAEKEIEETTDQVISAEQELEYAKLRMENGVGRNIDVLQAQLDRTTALISKAQALINFNNAQAQLLHDIGLAQSQYLLAQKPYVR